MEDVLGGTAALIQADDGISPVLRLDAVGRHKVGAGGSGPQIVEALAVEPLARHGIPMTDVDDYAPELHNPEVTEPRGSGNVPERNYKTIAALAARRGDIARDEIDRFVAERGMPGYAPTQGHLASALCYLPHAVGRLGPDGGAQRVMLLAKGSLFLGRMCQLSDGMSVMLERNRAVNGSPVIEATRETFRTLVADGQVLVDVWGPECQPCLALLPHVEDLAAQRAGQMTVVKLEAPKARRLCMELGLMTLPSFVLFRDGTEVARLSDPALNARKLDSWLNEHLEEVSTS